ncbi:MAG: LytTR family transcriptional regulator DNA-binding domain-containing protein [Bacteroidetes bacterium]|nr:LytTR family transcriptional regulator DNA-binding domain-containing protein [Bacteroidota bacterium]MBX7239558.1 LytTR family transcriptional regulator DNA-binding domain-containing protein [Bacteroidia bacterium]MCC7514681.1 LytTR family transcriptional regulator DNA-binding domain-containing protein [Bacteroidia bacterium]HCI59160.1 DNA-binding response regulator [Bacteroidota bacterium]HMU77963.1 LytTR family transcriptional regulator DNA-binding domain-containing protein [Bacteroidia ba
MIKAIVIDDEPLARSLVLEFLKAFPNIEVVQECNDGFEGLKAIQQFQPQLIFLDIQMPKINGFEMLELIENPPGVIFTTAFDNYAIKAFEAHAIDYLLKPFSQERFYKSVTKFLETNSNAAVMDLVNAESNILPDEKNRIVVKDGNRITIIPVDDVIYIEAYDDYVKVHIQNGFKLKKKTMSYYENTLDKSRFLRVHRSYIVNLSLITRIEQYEKTSHIALLKNGQKIPLSKQGYARLKSVLGI